MNAHEIYESLWNWLMNRNIFMKDNCDTYWKLEIPNYSRKITKRWLGIIEVSKNTDFVVYEQL